MTWWLILIPFLSAFVGWLINVIATRLIFYPLQPKKLLGFTFQGVIPYYKNQLTQTIVKIIIEKIRSTDEVENHLINPQSFEKIRPLVERHIDIFLREKLKTQMPVISTFIGEKTILQLKEVFIKELNELFPIVMRNYINVLKNEILGESSLENLEKIAGNYIEGILTNGLSAQLGNFRTYGAFSGFIIGLVQMLFIIMVILTGK